jgi:hypothetical protein
MHTFNADTAHSIPAYTDCCLGTHCVSERQASDQHAVFSGACITMNITMNIAIIMKHTPARWPEAPAAAAGMVYSGDWFVLGQCLAEDHQQLHCWLCCRLASRHRVAVLQRHPRLLLCVEIGGSNLHCQHHLSWHGWLPHCTQQLRGAAGDGAILHWSATVLVCLPSLASCVQSGICLHVFQLAHPTGETKPGAGAWWWGHSIGICLLPMQQA